MPKYSQKTISLMKSIVDASVNGKTFELPDHKAAVNMRQRIYNYRNALPDDVSDEHREAVSRVTVIVKENMVLVGSKEPDYMDDIESQLNEEENN